MAAHKLPEAVRIANRAESLRKYALRNKDQIAAYQREYRRANPALVRAANKRTKARHGLKYNTKRAWDRKSLAGGARVLWESAERRAREFGREFTISITDIRIPEICPASGRRLHDGRRIVGSPSIDRFDNDLGYTPSNIRVIDRRANRLKSNATYAEVAYLASYMREDSTEHTAVMSEYGWL